MVSESLDVLLVLDIQPIKPYNKKIRATEKAQNKEQLIPSTPRVLKYFIIEGINCIRLLICRRIVVTWTLFPFRFSINLEVPSSQGSVPLIEISILHLLLLL